MTGSPIPLSDCRWRPEVVAFADLMEAKLRENDHKPGWKGEDPMALMRRLHDEAAELAVEAFRSRSNTTLEAHQQRVAGEAADVANFAMMIADVCGGLPVTPLPVEAVEGVGKGDAVSRALDRFRQALAELPDITERHDRGQQFNAYDLVKGDMGVCIGPITDHPVCLVEAPEDVAELLTAALRLSSALSSTLGEG